MKIHQKIKRKLCLVALPSPFESEPAMDIPLGLAYISSYLKKHGYSDIKLVDFNLHSFDYYNSDDYLSLIPKDANVYGIQCVTAQFYWLVKVTEHIKHVNPSALIVSGGPHSSVRPEECIQKTKVDIAVIGEGEETLLEIMEGRDIHEIKGICSRDKENNVVRTPPRPFIKDLDSLPFPDRELVDLFSYKRTIFGHRALHFITLRGCPYNCSFCDRISVGRKIRYRSAENVLSEVDHVIARYKIKYFVPYDDCFILRKDRATKIAEGFRERGVRWRCWSRADLVSREILEILKKCGLTSITFGIESGDERMLKVYNKGITVEQNENALLLCKEVGVPVRASLIFGGPYETKESVDNTIDLIKRIQPDEWNISTFIPIPGSDIGDHPEKYDIQIHDDPSYMNYHRLGESGMGNIAVSISTLSSEEYEQLRIYMLERLLKECPRKVIQDTIQQFSMEENV